jgi:hypothetical protein
LGCKPKLTPHQVQEAIKRRDEHEETLREIARSSNVSHSTISRLAPRTVPSCAARQEGAQQHTRARFGPTFKITRARVQGDSNGLDGRILAKSAARPGSAVDLHLPSLVGSQDLMPL